MHYYQHHIGDYLKDTAHLSLLEHGVYLRLIQNYYATEIPLSNDFQKVCRSIGARSEDEISAVKGCLDDFFINTEIGWVMPRCDKEIIAYHEKSDKAKQSASKRWNVNRLHNEGNANAMRTHNEGNANHKPITKNQEPIEKQGQKHGANASRLPADWVPPDAYIDFCKTERPDLNPVFVADDFRDYWIAVSGQKAMKLDWMATWRRWVRNQKRQHAQIINKQTTRDSYAAQAAAASERMKQNEQPRDITSQCQRIT